MKARKSWIDVLKTLRDHRYKHRLLYHAKLSFTIYEENTIFHDKIDLNNMYTQTQPQKVLEEKPWLKEANYIHKNTDN